MQTLTTTPSELTATRVSDGVYSVEGDGKIHVVFVDEQDGPECLCGVFETTGTCPHAEAADEALRFEVEEARFEAMEEARFLMAWTADVHMNPDADLFLLTDPA